MIRAFLAAFVLALPQVALAEGNVPWASAVSTIAEKAEVDEMAFFYSRVCGTEKEQTAVWKIFNSQAIMVYRPEDKSDDAEGWRSQFRGQSEEDFPAGSCEKAKAGLLRSVYAPAFK